MYNEGPVIMVARGFTVSKSLCIELPFSTLLPTFFDHLIFMNPGLCTLTKAEGSLAQGLPQTTSQG